jgi:ketosteroid isomerase-like protein
MSAPHDDSTSRQNEATIASETRVVRAWHEALNSGDVDLLVELSHPDVEVGGPRGVGHGAQLLREWVGRAKIRLEPRRVFHREDTVVVEQWAKWRSADTGQVTSGQSVSSVFVVRDDRITCVMRYPDLADALDAANLDESYETPTIGGPFG